MLQPMNRPNFFPGQMVDYRDFNRLSQQADRTVATLCQYLFCGGGVVVDALEEFRIEPQEGLTVRVCSGVALLPEGQAICLSDDRLIDLAPYRESGDDPIVVSVAQAVLGSDRFVDAADPSVHGFRTELLLPEFRFSTGRAAEGTVELFRVALSPKAQSLRLADTAEGWTEKTLTGATPQQAILDLRFRPRIVPQTYVPVGPGQLMELRASLFAIERLLRKVERLYLVTDPYHSAEYLAQVHAEVLSRPFQPLKVSFLASEFSDRFCRYLELLARKLGAAGTKFDDQSLFAAAKSLEEFRVREVLPHFRPLTPFVTVASALDTFVAFAQANYRRIGVVEEALLDLRHRIVALDTRLLLAGHVFARVDALTVEHTDRFTIRAATTHARQVAARFRSGDRHEAKGIFFAQGTLDLELEIPNADRLACVLLRQYVRRDGTAIAYEVNGKAIGGEVTETSDEPNSWIQRGLVIPHELLVPGRNRLRIIVEHSDLDFGFFDVAVYQPELQEAANFKEGA